MSGLAAPSDGPWFVDALPSKKQNSLQLVGEVIAEDEMWDQSWDVATWWGCHGTCAFQGANS